MSDAGTALITGSTSGIGKSFANLLAQNGYDLILVSRNAEKLSIQSEQLQSSYPRKVFVIVCDLKKSDSADNVYREVKRMGLEVRLLVNNAGFNECGNFLQTDIEKEMDMMYLHMIFTTKMMKLFLPKMVEDNYGRILNVGSTASYISCPYDAVYAATKAYILSVSKGVAAELKSTEVRITTLCPGSTKTEFAAKAGIENTLLFKLFVMNPDKVANIGYRALIKGKTSVVAGIYNKILVFSSYLLPEKLVNFLTRKMLRN